DARAPSETSLPPVSGTAVLASLRPKSPGLRTPARRVPPPGARRVDARKLRLPKPHPEGCAGEHSWVLTMRQPGRRSQRTLEYGVAADDAQFFSHQQIIRRLWKIRAIRKIVHCDDQPLL